MPTTKEKIDDLILAGKSFDDICKALKDEPVKDIKQNVGRRWRKHKKGKLPTAVNKEGGERKYHSQVEKPDQVFLTCKTCKRTFSIHTQNRDMYTPAVRANWECIICKPWKQKKRPVARAQTIGVENDKPQKAKRMVRRKR